MLFRPRPASTAIAAAVWAILLGSLLLARGGFAASEVVGDVINAPKAMEGGANLAAGSDNTAAHSSISLKNTKIGGIVANTMHSGSSLNVASGKNNTATQGSISVSQSTVKGGVHNSGETKNSSNLAVGRDNQASQSSVVVKNSLVGGSLSNSSVGNGSVNIAAGTRNQANQSTVTVRNSALAGTVANSAAGNLKVNAAVGTDNRAEQGAIRVENSSVRGKVVNTAQLNKSANMAVGTANSAAQGAVAFEGTRLQGMVVNAATAANAANAAVGYRNEANQASIVVDGGQPGGWVYQPPSTTVAQAYGSGPAQEVQARLPVGGRGDGKDLKGGKTAQHVPGQVIFLVDNDKAGLAGLDRIAKKYGLEVGKKTVLRSLNRIMVVSSVKRDAAEVAASLKKETGIHNPQPNYVFATMGQEDPLSSMQNLVAMLDLPALHGKVSGRKVTVAVIDTGVEVEHEDLRSRLVGHQNFIDDSPYQGEVHGTAVAGIIGAANNDCGIVGIAPQVSMLALRACRQVDRDTARGECFSTSLVQSVDAAILARADVVNLSLGAYVEDDLLGVMIDSGHEQGMVFAAPVGNDPNAERLAFPASHDKVISVAGFDEQGRPLPNRRLAVMADAVAPATNIFTTIPGNGYNFIDGTSLASASITGILALARERKPGRGEFCVPRLGSAIPWSKQVYSCLDL
mgnify:CR=1 FL=1